MWLSGFRVVLPNEVLDCGSVLIEDGKIAEIREGEVLSHSEGIDGQGLTLIPGLVDMHGDMYEREVQPRPRANIPADLALHELDKRLVATGITTAYAAISFTWDAKSDLRSEEKARLFINTVNELRPTLLADHYVHSRFEITNPAAGEVLQELLSDHKIHLVSVMDHTPGQGQYRDIEKFVKHMAEWKNLHGDQGHVTEDDMRQYVLERQSWPKAWDIVKDVAEHATDYGVVLASHDDDTVDKVNFMNDFGVRLSEFPVSAEAADHARSLGMHVAMGAPNAMRGGSLSGNLNAAEAVADGLVDTLASDYHPASMLHAAYALHRNGTLPLNKAINLVSANPAHGVGLTDRGRIEVGKRADMVILDDSGLPRVHATLREGQKIYWDRRMHELIPA